MHLCIGACLRTSKVLLPRIMTGNAGNSNFASATGAPLLFTPGPLTIPDATREAMGKQDWGSRDPKFIAMNERILAKLLEIAGASNGDYVCVPMQGSGTFALEAMVGTLVPRPESKMLILVNGAYGRRMGTICARIGIKYHIHEYEEHTTPTAENVAALLKRDDLLDVTHVCLCHCETSSGILNPVEKIAKVVKAHGKAILVDAMSAFGALSLPGDTVQYDALVSSANKCLEGGPGLSFVIVRKDLLLASANRCHSLSLDLYEQHINLTKTGQYRFTPPTHIIAALDHAISLYFEEGGLPARRARYVENYQTLRAGMESLGFKQYLADDVQAPIIVSFYYPKDAKFSFDKLYQRLADMGIVIYPGKLTKANTFRIGCIGRLCKENVDDLLSGMKQVLEEMGVQDMTPDV